MPQALGISCKDLPKLVNRKVELSWWDVGNRLEASIQIL